jgi:hypothetical protein
MKEFCLIAVVCFSFSSCAPFRCYQCSKNKEDLLVRRYNEPNRYTQEEAKNRCQCKGDGWYLPSNEELENMRNLRNYTYMTNIMGEGRPSGREFYWTSDLKERPVDFFKIDKMKRSSISKTSKFLVRCVKIAPSTNPAK